LLPVRAVLFAVALALPFSCFNDVVAQGRSTPESRVTEARATPAVVAPGGTIQSIRIEGAQRIEPGTIRSYMLLQAGDSFDPDRIDRSLKTLYATGLFSDVSLTRDGNVLVVRVVENPIINRIAFEGNHKLSDDTLRPDLQLKVRGVFTPAAAQSDRQRILDLYAKKGRYDAQVTPKVINLDRNRVDVVFEITEGEVTLTSRIAFVGNHAFDEERLREVIASREQAWFRFLSSSDEYDPDRVSFDKELLRRFYLKNGYVDFKVANATAELSPDRKSFFLTFTVSEGERYRVRSIKVESQLRKLNGDDLLPDIQLEVGDWYDGDAVDRSVTAMNADAQNRGYPFVDVKPRISRDTKDHTVDLVFNVGEGPRVYVERIDIQGNTRTEDKVIRRQFAFAEGDAFNAATAKRTRQRLQDLGYFSNVTITPSPGSAPDKAIVTTSLEEKSTGELSLGGGYSTDVGALLNVGVKEKNFLGTGVEAGISGVLAQRSSSIDLSVSDPYFLDRNLVAGIDLFYIDVNNELVAQYSERRGGISLRVGYDFNEHLRQQVNYTAVDRDVYNVYGGYLANYGPYTVNGTTFAYPALTGFASYYLQADSGWTVLSQFGQTFTIDYRDSPTAPHEGFLVRLGVDAAGAGGDARFIRAKIDGNYYIPLDRFTGNSDWGVKLAAGTGYFFNLGQQEQIIDRFFLGGDNLRGFLPGGAGPHDPTTGDALGGRFIYTGSTELHYPLPVSPDIGVSGRAFIDVGALTGANFESGRCPGSGYPLSYYGYLPSSPGDACPPIYDKPTPRIGAGVGVSWQTPFGLINIDLAPFVVKQSHDQTELIRFGFGTRF
jgi:outer membrane protein insertion porin family